MKTESRLKTAAIASFAFLMFSVLAVRLFQLQVLEGEDYRQLSFENRLRIEMLPSPRGIIHDRNGKPLVRNAPYYYIALLPEMRGKADLDRIADFLSMEVAEIRELIRKEKNPFAPVKLKEGLSFEEVAFTEARLSDHPALSILVEQTRHYPYGELGAHVVGYLGKVNPAQIKRKDFKGVPRQASIGQWGVEKMFDSFLRGKPGKRAIEADALGRRLRLLKEEQPQQGNDLYLSIDLNLQKAAEEAFGDRMGALVALKPTTGEILAMVSRPSFDPNLFSRGINYDDWLRLSRDKQYPMLNRALQSQFPPGSTFKIVTAIAALEEEAITPRTTATCTGSLRRGRWEFGCWKRGGHGTLALHRALVESCDVYFYRAGEAAGIDSIAKYSRQLGLETESGLGLVKEKRGLIPDSEWKQRVKNKPWYLGETLNAAIGQGFVLTTPIQLARMISAVANGGYLYAPTLKRVDAQPEPVLRADVSDKTLETIRAALRDVVADNRGTGIAARSRFFSIGGKTGTAQVISQKENRMKEEETPYSLRDHAWFIAFAPFEDPEIAVSVFVEHGGHGGSAAAPIARKAIEAYMKSLVMHSDEEKYAELRNKFAAQKPKPAELKPKPAELRPEPAELKPEPAELKPEPAELKPKPAELKPKPAELKPEPAELRPEPAELKPEPAELKPKPAELRPEPAELKPEPAELKVEPSPEKQIPSASETIPKHPGDRDEN